MLEARDYVKELGLEPHPEGGYFKEMYRAEGQIPKSVLPDAFKGDRNYATSIFYMLEGEQISTFHRIQSDELWHFYAGTALTVHMIDSKGNASSKTLGPRINQGEELLFYVPAGVWFASEVIDKTSFCLAGCTVAPGFDFEDFEMARRVQLLKEFPEHQELITRLTRA